MKRLLLLMLSLLLFFTACSDQRKLVRDEQGGYTDKKSDIRYAALAAHYEPAKGGEVFGVCEEEDSILEFRVIPELDSAKFLADDDRTVYFAGDDFLPAEKWTPKHLLICEGAVVSFELARISDAAVLGEVLSTWFEDAAGATMPNRPIVAEYRLKLEGKDYPNILYCFTFYSYGGGLNYFHDSVSGRTVAVPADIAEHFLSLGGA
jgi:hypothetical protein